MNWKLVGADVLGPEGLARAEVAITGGRIAAEAETDAKKMDLSGLWLLPGIVDLHGDAVERIIMPRPGIRFPLDLALLEADRQLVANGITTAYHALTVGWEPGLRNVASAREFVAALTALSGRLDCDTRLNFRWETFAIDEAEEMIGWFARFPDAILSLNDHTTVNLALPPEANKIRRMADRSGLSPDDCVTRLAQVARRVEEVPGAVVRVTAAAQAAGLTCLAHDEPDPTTRDAHRALGVRVTEFPMTRDTARAARDADEHVVFGAPNVLRGGSQNGAVDAAPALFEGLGTVLATDYWYPAPLGAAFRLADAHGMDFPAAWACISANPAAAAGLSDRGQLRPGLRADVIALCPRRREVRAVWIAGRRVLTRA